VKIVVARHGSVRDVRYSLTAFVKTQAHTSRAALAMCAKLEKT
jgi:hypothetical protein